MLTLWFLSAFSAACFAASLTGPVDRLNDGDTFEIGGQKIRLKGIDAPEASQSCQDQNAKSYPCGDYATNYLRTLVQGQQVTCRGDEKDDYGRLIAYCFIDNQDLNRQMVASGWAVAYRRYDLTYVDQEAVARANSNGIWRGKFVQPAVYRSKAWQKARRVADSQGKECLIKGNITSEGDRIYHTPWGSRHYSRTRISTSRGERWFCDEAEALAAGWRAPLR